MTELDKKKLAELEECSAETLEPEASEAPEAPPEAVPTQPAEPAPVAQPLRAVPLKDGAYAKIFGNSGATIHGTDKRKL